MTKINCMILGFSLMGCSIVAMDRNTLTKEERLRIGRILEYMEPNASRRLDRWERNNKSELDIWEARNKQKLEMQYRLNMKLLELK